MNNYEYRKLFESEYAAYMQRVEDGMVSNTVGIAEANRFLRDIVRLVREAKQRELAKFVRRKKRIRKRCGQRKS